MKDGLPRKGLLVRPNDELEGVHGDGDWLAGESGPRDVDAHLVDPAADKFYGEIERPFKH